MNGTIEHLHSKESSADSTNHVSDETLMRRYCEKGDRVAFDELVHRYERELFGYLRHYLGNAELAEDAFQQTFLQVHLKCHQFDPRRRVRPWLYTVATNQAIDLQRRQKRHKMVSLDRRTTSKREEDVGALGQLVDAQEHRPEDQAELLEQRAQIREAVDSLPEQARQVLLLVYFQGMKYREAADVLSIPVGTVKSRLHAAMNKLGESLNHTRLPK